MLKKYLRAIALATLTTALLVPPAFAHAEPNTQVNMLVTFRQKPGQNEHQLISGLGGKVKKSYSLVPTVLASVSEQDITTLRKNPNVLSIEPDAAVTVTGDAGPGAPIGTPTGKGTQVLPWGIDRIDAELVHATNKGAGVKIAILDTGIDLDHPDLRVAGNVTFANMTNTGDDDNGHGTIIAGIIAALDNDIGVVGVAPEASIYSVKVLGSNGSGWISEIINGIEWAVNNDMDMIVMNFSAGGAGAPGGMSQLSLPIQNAYNAGIVIIAGSGNNGNIAGTGNSVTNPANEKGVIAVGGTDNTDARYSASSTGYLLDVVAPGVSISSTAMGGAYASATGTSFSSPHAAGIAALLIKSGITNNLDVGRRLRDSAQNLGPAGWDTQFGKGIVNAYAALNFSEKPDKSAPVTTLSFAATTGNGGWYKSDALITINAIDYGNSGVASSQYSLDAGYTWINYSGPFSITTENMNIVIARSIDNAGNDEGVADFVWFRIDKTPPVITLIASPEQVVKSADGTMFTISHNGTWSDVLSGYGSMLGDVTDEYGEYSNLEFNQFDGQTTVAQWCRVGDQDGRLYTFRLYVTDYAGNTGYVDAIIRVIGDGSSTQTQQTTDNATKSASVEGNRSTDKATKSAAAEHRQSDSSTKYSPAEGRRPEDKATKSSSTEKKALATAK